MPRRYKYQDMLGNWSEWFTIDQVPKIDHINIKAMIVEDCMTREEFIIKFKRD